MLIKNNNNERVCAIYRKLKKNIFFFLQNLEWMGI